MRQYTVVICEVETRTYTLKANSREEARARAEEANENPSGSTPEGFDDYSFSFHSETQDVLP